MTREEILAVAKPILFNTDMVRAILDGRKSVTRRVMKPQPILNNGIWLLDGAGWSDGVSSVPIMPGHSLYNRLRYKTGDYLYVPEPWKCYAIYNTFGYEVKFKDGESVYFEFTRKERAKKWAKYLDKPEHQWQSPYFMPKEAARIFLRVTDVRVERLQDMKPEDVRKEGMYLPILPKECKNSFDRFGAISYYEEERENFSKLWNSTIHKKDMDKYGWDASPWVWVIEFERVEIQY